LFIDVQGAESKVLDGLDIDTNRPKFIVLEAESPFIDRLDLKLLKKGYLRIGGLYDKIYARLF